MTQRGERAHHLIFSATVGTGESRSRSTSRYLPLLWSSIKRGERGFTGIPSFTFTFSHERAAGHKNKIGLGKNKERGENVRMWIISRREKGEQGEGRTECQVKTCSEFLMERTERERERKKL
jgi:hypothetical protein